MCPQIHASLAPCTGLACLLETWHCGDANPESLPARTQHSDTGAHLRPWPIPQENLLPQEPCNYVCPMSISFFRQASEQSRRPQEACQITRQDHSGLT